MLLVFHERFIGLTFPIVHLKFVTMLNSIASGIAGLFGLGFNIHQANQANKWNQKQLDAQIAENQKNRDFSSAEAAIARNFQADFAREMFDKTNKYNSMSNQVAQMKQSGLNPALAYSGNSFVPGSMPSVSPSAASSSGSVSPTQYATTDVAGPALATARQFAEIEAIKAQTDKTKSETEGQGYQNEILRSDSSVRDAWNAGELQLKNVAIRTGESGIRLTDEEAKKVRSEAQLLQLQVDNFNKTLELLDTQITSGNLENEIKKIELKFKTPEFEAKLRDYAASAGLKESQAFAIIKKLPKEIELMGAEAAYYNAASELAKLQGVKVERESEGVWLDVINKNNYRQAVTDMGWFGKTLDFLRELSK